jgi:hypothetical protein
LNYFILFYFISLVSAYLAVGNLTVPTAWNVAEVSQSVIQSFIHSVSQPARQMHTAGPRIIIIISDY